jgi:hypothetical protein
MQSSRGDTHALSLFCDERHESSYFELRQAGLAPPHLKKAGPTAMAQAVFRARQITGPFHYVVCVMFETG